MKVAVTGGSGRIGAPTVRVLRAAGHEVLSLDRVPPADLSIPHRVIDLTDKDAVRRVFDGCEAVCHLGEIPSVINGDHQRAYAHNTHVGSLVMESAVQVGVKRIVYTSSCQVYGCFGVGDHPYHAPVRLPFDETHPCQPHNAYALSKSANETYAQLLADRAHVDIAAFRFPGTFTDEQANLALQKMLSRPAPRRLHRDGMGAHLHADDAARAYLAALDAEFSGFEAFHFTTEHVVCDIPVRDAMLEILPHLPLPSDWPASKCVLLCDKAQRILKWTARYSLRDAYLRANEARRKAI